MGIPICVHNLVAVLTTSWPTTGTVKRARERISARKNKIGLEESLSMSCFEG